MIVPTLQRGNASRDALRHLPEAERGASLETFPRGSVGTIKDPRALQEPWTQVDRLITRPSRVSSAGRRRLTTSSPILISNVRVTLRLRPNRLAVWT